MIPARPEADINQREETTMAFVISLAIAFTGGLFTGFHQSKTNPDADNFLQTKSHVAYVD
jgi:hypothetical protein